MRVKVIEYWIEVARECINLGNFNSLMGIITDVDQDSGQIVHTRSVKDIKASTLTTIKYYCKLNKMVQPFQI